MNSERLNYIEHEVKRLFSYHEAKHIDDKCFDDIRNPAKALARAIYLHEGARWEDSEIAIQKLRECVFYAIASMVVPV